MPLRLGGLSILYCCAPHYLFPLLTAPPEGKKPSACTIPTYMFRADAAHVMAPIPRSLISLPPKQSGRQGTQHTMRTGGSNEASSPWFPLDSVISAFCFFGCVKVSTLSYSNLASCLTMSLNNGTCSLCTEISEARDPNTSSLFSNYFYQVFVKTKKKNPLK